MFATADSGYSVGVGVGVAVAFSNGMVLRVGGNHFAFDTDLEGWSISGGFGAPLYQRR